MNFPVILIALFFGLYATAHFVWHAFPQSDAEIVCDGITALITALAFVRWTKP